MTGSKIQQPITTISGNYYAGMTRAEAEQNDTYKKTVGMDFKDIDTDSDGNLSDIEICDARDKEVERIKNAKTAASIGSVFVGAGVGVALTGVGAGLGAVIAEAGVVGASYGSAKAVADGNGDFLVTKGEKDLDAEIAKTAQYREEHGFNVET